MNNEFDLTPEEFYNGFEDYIKNNPTKVETETPLDKILENGIPKEKITILIGQSNVDSLMVKYIKYLINLK